MRVPGIHHVTAISGDPTETVRFYRDVLGLRLVKRTVNFDDPTTYHLYFGDETGSPGTALTFFPFDGGRQGRVGRGQVTATAFVVPEGSLDYWRERLADHGADVGEVAERFGETVLPFTDRDGQPMELVTGTSDVEPWADGPVPAEHAVRGFHGVTLTPTDPDATAAVLDLLGYEAVGEDGNRTRYAAAGDRAAALDLVDAPDAPEGVEGVGTVHHVAVRTADDAEQADWRERLVDAGYRPTEVKDRQYFRSIYVREPGGVLFEIATDGPGFTADEDVASLGESLKLPPWLAEERDRLEAALPDLDDGTVVEQ